MNEITILYKNTRDQQTVPIKGQIMNRLNLGTIQLFSTAQLCNCSIIGIDNNQMNMAVF